MQINSRLQLLIAMLIMVICVVLVIFVNKSFVREKILGENETVREQADQFSKGYLEITAEVIQVDPVANRLTLELNFTPHGRLDAGDGVLKVPLEINVS